MTILRFVGTAFVVALSASLSISLSASMSIAFAADLTTAATPQRGCEATKRSDAVVIVVCPRGLAQEVWREAGKRACGQSTVCNAWIWDDATKAPATAPAKDSDLPKTATAHAVAVWANDSQSLLVIKRAAK